MAGAGSGHRDLAIAGHVYSRAMSSRCRMAALIVSRSDFDLDEWCNRDAVRLATIPATDELGSVGPAGSGPAKLAAGSLAKS